MSRIKRKKQLQESEEKCFFCNCVPPFKGCQHESIVLHYDKKMFAAAIALGDANFCNICPCRKPMLVAALAHIRHSVDVFLQETGIEKEKTEIEQEKSVL